ncbi:MAG: aldehyde dehydrogenase, partial [Natronosporangium sp.]
MSTPATLFVDGSWLPAAGGGTREIRCPADGGFVTTVSEAGVEDTLRAIAAARRAFDRGDWPGTPAPR